MAHADMSLATIGFTREERHACLAWPDARLGARAEIEGDGAVLLVSTGVRLDLSLEGSYVGRRGFPVLRQNESFGACALTDFHALGRGRPHETAVFFGDPEPPGRSTYAGRLGVEYVSDAILGLDAAGPTIGLGLGDAIRESFDSAICRLPLVPDTASGVPVTLAIRESNAPDSRLALVIDTGATESYLTWSYVEVHWPGRMLSRARRALRKGKVVDLELQLCGLKPIAAEIRLRSSPPRYAVEVGVDEIHGVLGIDVLRLWIQVFDFPGRELALFDY